MSIKRPKVTAEAGRALWTELLARVATPDEINARIMQDDGFAQVIGERVQKLLLAERSRGGPDLTA